MGKIDPVFWALALILVLLMVFIIVLLRSLASAAGARIRSDMQRLLESYDNILEQKADEIEDLRRQADALKKEMAQAGPDLAPTGEGGEGRSPIGQASVPSAASYRAESFSGGYGAIREHFHLDDPGRDELLEQVAAETEELAKGRGRDAARLRQSLSFDTLFRLSQLESERQLEVLDTSLDDLDWTLLRDFCEERPDEPFDVNRFCGWLEDLAALESDTIQVRSGDRQARDASYQERICEGVQIVAGNKLYDYSIDEREIS